MPSRSTIKRFVPLPLLRLRVLASYGGFARTPVLAARYLVSGTELDNFTYDIANRGDLAGFLSRRCGAPASAYLAAIRELDDDRWLAGELEGRLAATPGRRPVVHFGRRLGWYALTRVARPALVVETGIHDGLGSATFLRALERNAADGHDGELLSFDVREDVGWVIPDRLRSRHRMVIGDSVGTLGPAIAGRQVDLFLHDSLHTYDHETAELEAVLPHAGPGTVLLSDNAHSSTAMADVCRRHGLPFELWRDRPVDHFYPGCGIGLAVVGAAQPGTGATGPPPAVMSPATGR